MSLLIDPVVQDRTRRAAAIRRLRDVGGRLPTWTQLAAPQQALSGGLKDVDPDDADPRNLWRVHWFNGPDRKTMTDTPGYMVLPPELTGVKAPLVGALFRLARRRSARGQAVALATQPLRSLRGRGWG